MYVCMYVCVGACVTRLIIGFRAGVGCINVFQDIRVIHIYTLHNLIEI
jgi:hypothetical protein